MLTLDVTIPPFPPPPPKLEDFRRIAAETPFIADLKPR
jgi:hypothetical protein